MRSSKSLITFFNTPSPDHRQENESPSKNLPLSPTETCLQLASHENISSLSLLLRSLNELPEADTYLIPFLVTQSLFMHFAGLYLSTAIKHIDETHAMQTSKVPFSSCSENAAGLLCLFSGIRKSKHTQTLSNLSITTTIDPSMPLRSIFDFLKPAFKFDIVDLFKGEAMGHMQVDDVNSTNHELEQIKSRLLKYLSLSLDRYQAHMSAPKTQKGGNQPTNEEFINQYIKQAVKYEFNIRTITALKTQIQMNTAQTRTTQSFIYYIRAIEADRKTVHHAFLLEQFFHPQTNSNRFRLYQAWLDVTDLSKSISQQLLPLTHQSWTLEEAMVFMNKLMRFYSSDVDNRISEFECFGLGSKTIDTRNDPYFIDMKFVGRTIEYYCLPVNPRDCVTHLREIAETSTELKRHTM